MPIKARVFLFISFLFAFCFAFNNQSSNALSKENNISATAAKASPTPKGKSTKPRKQRTRKESEGPIACYFVPVNMTLSTSILYLPCDNDSSSDCPVDNNYLVGVSAGTSEPKEGKLIYRYGVTGGKVIGEGGNVQWDLSNVPEGKYLITTLVESDKGYFTTQSKEVEIVKCKCGAVPSVQTSIAGSSKSIEEPTPTPTPEIKSNKPRKQRTQRKSEQVIIEPPRANLTTSSDIVYLPCDDGNYSSECPNNQVISVAAGATDPDGERITYSYNVSVGKIIGEGGNVQWDLSGVPEGKYEIGVKVNYKYYGFILLKKEIEVVKCKCKSIQNSLDSSNESETAANQTSSFPMRIVNNKNNPHGFLIDILIGRPKPRRQIENPNRAPILNSKLSSLNVYLPCDNEELSNGRNFLIDVFANATDPDGDTLLYTYNVQAGKIIGEGKQVQWDLSDVPEGKYKITFIVDDGKGYVVTQEQEIEVVKCKSTQTSFGSVDDSDNKNTEVAFNSLPQATNANNPHGFIIALALGRQDSRRFVEIPPNNSPILQTWLSLSTVYLPCEVEGYPSSYKLDVFSIGNDIDGDTLLYTFDVSVGKIIGNGANAQWDLSGVPSGKHKITAQVDDGKGAVTEQVLELEVIRFGCPQTK